MRNRPSTWRLARTPDPSRPASRERPNGSRMGPPAAQAQWAWWAGCLGAVRSCWWRIDSAAIATGPRDSFGSTAGRMEQLADGFMSDPSSLGLHCYADALGSGPGTKGHIVRSQTC
jgi:hypothetical protein